MKRRGAVRPMTKSQKTTQQKQAKDQTKKDRNAVQPPAHHRLQKRPRRTEQTKRSKTDEGPAGPPN
eukprot:5797920-Amphidinium_carterae.1